MFYIIEAPTAGDGKVYLVYPHTPQNIFTLLYIYVSKLKIHTIQISPIFAFGGIIDLVYTIELKRLFCLLVKTTSDCE